MNKESFIRYCAEVMGYTQNADNGYWYEEGKYLRFVNDYNPYGNLNQMAAVVEKLLEDANIYMEGKFPNKYMFSRDGIKQAFRDFIISTMEKDNE